MDDQEVCFDDILERARRLMLLSMDVESVMVEISTSSPEALDPSNTGNDLLGIIREQSIRLDISPILMATKLFCSRLVSIGNSNIEQSDNAINSVLMVGRCLQDNRLIGYHCLGETIRKEFANIGIFVVWKLSVAKLIDIKDILNCHNEWMMKGICEALTNQLILYLQSPNPPSYRNQLVDDYTVVIVEASAISKGTDSINELLVKAAKNILFKLIDGNYTDDNVQTISFYSFLESSSLVTDVKENIYTTILQHFIMLPPLITVLECLPNQSDYQYSLLSPSIIKLFTMVTKELGPSLSWTIIKDFLQQYQKLNCSYLFSFVSCFVQCHSESFSLKEKIKEIIVSVIGETTPTFNESILYGAIAVARQCSLEGSHVFPSYSNWFKQTFGDSFKSVIRNLKSLSFLLKSLTNSIQYDPPYCLQGHLEHPPKRLSNCLLIVSEYLDLVRSRLCDLNEPFVTSSTCDGSNMSELALADNEVEEVLATYQSHDCQLIPNHVKELNIFNQLYYTEKFLKSLLAPRKTPAIPDARSKLISAMVISEMIPSKFMKKYNSDCLKLMSNEEVSDYSPLYDSLVTELQRMIRHINDNEVNFKGVLSRLSKSIATVIKDSSSQYTSINNTLLDLAAPGLQEWQIQITDHLLSYLCECILKLCTQLIKPDPVHITHFNSVTMFVEMLSSHVTVHKGLFVRLWELLHLQIIDLTDDQLLSLSIVLAECLINHTPYVSINVKTCCQLFNLVPVTTIKTPSEYAMFLLNSLSHYSLTSMINTNKILCHVFQHFCTTNNYDVFAGNSNSVNSCLRMCYIKLKYFQERIMFCLIEEMYSSMKLKNELDILFKMICTVIEQPIIQTAFSIDKDDYWKAGLQLDFMIHAAQDYFTSLQRHTFRRSLIVNAGVDGFQTLFCLLIFLKNYSETRQPFCCSSHEQMFNYIVTIGWNEGIQLLMELSSGLTYHCENESTVNLFNFFLDQPRLYSVVVAKLNLPVTDHRSLHSIEESEAVVANSCLNCLLALSPHIFYNTVTTTIPSQQSLTTSMNILKMITGPLFCHGLVVPLSFTCHLFKGFLQFLSATLWSERLNHLLNSSPIFLASVLFWWKDIRKYIPEISLQSDTPLQRLDNAFTHIQRGTIQSSSYLLSHCEATAICTAGLISASRLGNVSHHLQQLNSLQPPSNRTFQLLVADCCVIIILTTSTTLFEKVMYDGCLATDIMNTLQFIINNDVSLWPVLLNEEQREVFSVDNDVIFDQLKSFRVGVSIIMKPAVHYNHLLLLVFLTECNKPLLRKLLGQDGLLEEFLTAHKSIVNGGTYLKNRNMSVCQAFLKSTFTLAKWIISNSSKQKLQECLDICHDGLRLYIKDFIS